MKIDVFLQNLGISGHPGLRVSRRSEGYRNYTFGCRAGPCKANVRDLAHELAHAAQFGPRSFKNRAFEYGFDFRMRQVLVLGRYYSEPRTPQATLRELDTFAYQAHLMELAGIKLDRSRFFKHAADLMTRFMTDWYCVPGDDEQARKAWCMERVNALYARRKPETVLRRLKGWLDETQVRLQDLQKGQAHDA